MFSFFKVFKNFNKTEVEYRSSNYSNISGVEIYIKRSKLILKTSLHKYWQNKCYSKLRNDNLFTISESKLAFEMLLSENHPDEIDPAFFAEFEWYTQTRNQLFIELQNLEQNGVVFNGK